MAKNKITIESNDKGHFIIKGSIRQPTLNEAVNILLDKGFEGGYIVCVYASEYISDDDCKSITLIPYEEKCPICGHEYDVFGDYCPICKREWS